MLAFKAIESMRNRRVISNMRANKQGPVCEDSLDKSPFFLTDPS